ncbi:MAG TPA: hypothetical protein VKA21_13080, partial [Candidatus Binatia bacterium]|nr:hypothetical protein [Candidatus Binatia bacterium]
MRLVLVLLLVAGAAGLLLTRAEPFRPTVALDTPIDFVGRATPIRIVARDRGTGLARVEVRLLAASGAAATVASESYPPGDGWLGTGAVHEATLTPTLDAVAARLPEGPATLEVRVTDHSWLAALRPAPPLERPVTIDVAPPTVELLSTQHVVRLGGTECAVYRVGADAVASGVQVGDTRFPASTGM